MGGIGSLGVITKSAAGVLKGQRAISKLARSTRSTLGVEKMAAQQHERQARFLPPRNDAPRLDAASLPAAGASARHNLNTQDEQRLKEGSAPTHYTFVDGAVHERPGGRRPAPRGVNETRVHECLGHADADVDALSGPIRPRSEGRRAPPEGANATRVHECFPNPTLALTDPDPNPSPNPNPDAGPRVLWQP